MTNGIIVDNISWPSSLPLSQTDAVLRDTGSLWLFDAAISAPTSLAVSGTWANQVRGAPVATVKNSTGLTLGGGGLIFAGTGAYLDAGSTYDLTGKQLVMTATLKFQSLASGVSAVMGRGTSGTVSNQFLLGSVSTGTTLRSNAFTKAAAASDPPTGHTSTAVAGTIYHIALGIEKIGADTRMTRWLNGVQVQTDTVTASAGLLAPPNSTAIGIGRYDGIGSQGSYKGTIYRLYSEDIGVTARTVTAVVAADYAVASAAGRYT